MPIEILMPALSPTMTEGGLAKWLASEGDTISSGDVMAEIETDKATMEVEAVDEGILGKIVVAEGTNNVPVNSVIALLLEEGESKDAIKDWKPAKAEVQAAETVEEKTTSDNSPSPTAPAIAAQATKAPEAPKYSAKTDDRVIVSPLAKRLAESYNIPLSRIKGTGPKGRIVKEDVENAKLGGTVSRDNVVFTTEENSAMRKAVAKRLLQSKQQVPHFYLTIDCQIDALLDLRKQLNDKAAREAGDDKPAYKISVNDCVIKASALAMHDVPQVNTSWYDDATVHYNNVDISVAVAIEGGLITPIIANADQKSLPQISNEIKQLAGRARKGDLKPEEYEGGGFSISNLGMYGIKQFSAIVNPPQSCILAVGAGEKRPVVNSSGDIEVANVMTVTLSVDHRTVDGAVGAEFLQAFKLYIEQPATMLI